jgi:DNA recombination protein RmuC
MTDILVAIGWLAALALGFVTAWVIQKYRLGTGSALSAEEKDAHEKNRLAGAEALARLKERTEGLDREMKAARESAENLREENTGLRSKLAASGERELAQEKRLEEQKEIDRIQKKMILEFENLANRILETKSKKFVAQNQESLDKLLNPLGERIKEFGERVEKAHQDGLKDRAALGEQLNNLRALNQRMSEEAQNLTTALKGQSKTQGNWGEMILERVLEKSGLTPGQEYETQSNLKDEEGRRFQPDVIVKLPEDKHLVVDSKVSLLAYEACINESDSDIAETRIKEHVASMRSHVSDLSSKSYDALHGINSPDFVLMFVPVEPAFTMAMQADDGLFDFAFSKGVVIVTPSTLLATLRTVANIWRQEKQNRNVLEIARLSGRLYDKFVGFYGDMEEIGNRLGRSQEAYEAALNKLRSGRGNLVRSVEEIKKLGAKAQKSLPQEAIEESLLEEMGDEE